ncbi:hypothetical protein N657DRAFT_388112 [Parathielavia appendiculata]|uniref:Uncharacterized protein n=1 Tax=Parathielavia appendiculata TaxID=2587402 RepID=A0AAN6Z4X2_9PEZI|nr:hypothetical protein N657DRAFT_388112 [Parathielavia appendiculata]
MLNDRTELEEGSPLAPSLPWSQRKTESPWAVYEDGRLLMVMIPRRASRTRNGQDMRCVRGSRIWRACGRRILMLACWVCFPASVWSTPRVWRRPPWTSSINVAWRAKYVGLRSWRMRLGRGMRCRAECICCGRCSVEGTVKTLTQYLYAWMAEQCSA